MNTPSNHADTPFDADEVKATLEQLTGQVNAVRWVDVSPVIYGAFVITTRLCWAALDEVDRLRVELGAK